MSYTKLHASILDSTVWDTALHVKVVWITMLAMADRDGTVEASIPGLAKRAGVERGQCEQALALFLAPDPDSRTQEHEGRRIVEIDGGWALLNHAKYRHKASAEDAAEKNRARQKRWRDNNSKSRDVTPNAVSNDSVTPSNASNDIAEAEAEAEAEADAEATHIQTAPLALVCVGVPQARTTEGRECAFGDVAEGGKNPEPPPLVQGWHPQRLASVLSAGRTLVGGGPYGYRQTAWQELYDACAVFAEANPDDPADAAAWAFAAWAKTEWARKAKWPVSAFLADAGKHLGG